MALTDSEKAVAAKHPIGDYMKFFIQRRERRGINTDTLQDRNGENREKISASIPSLLYLLDSAVYDHELSGPLSLKLARVIDNTLTKIYSQNDFDVELYIPLLHAALSNKGGESIWDEVSKLPRCFAAQAFSESVRVIF